MLITMTIVVRAMPPASGDNSTSSWTSPTAMALKLVGPASDSLSQAAFESNITCTTLTYRRPYDSTIRSGCFVPTAFGMFDTNTSDTIFNGSSEGVPLRGYIAGESFVPWPNAGALLVLDMAETGGAYLSFYRDPTNAVQDVRDLAGRLIAKQFKRPHDDTLKDNDGKPLLVNPQTLAFSSTGYWLVAETLTGSFVRINLATLDSVRFAPSFYRLGFPGLLESQVAISDDGRFASLHNNDDGKLTVYDLSTCVATAGRPFQTCASFDYGPFVKSKITNFNGIYRLRFINDDTISLTARSGSSPHSYLLAPRASITHLLDYLALGDSYTSGEGAFDYLLGTDTDSNGCHLSRKSYPLLITNRIFSVESGRSVACSGAVINDLGAGSTTYRGQIKGALSYQELQQTYGKVNQLLADFTPGNLAQHYFVKKYQPRVITVSAGGNDIGFGDILEECVTPRPGSIGNNTCFSTYEDRQELRQLIDKTGTRLTALYEELHQDSPESIIYAVGYPQIADDTGNCGLNVHLNKSELGFASELIATMNNQIHKAAQEGGAMYLDIGQALNGHRLCESTFAGIAMNGVTAGKDGKVLGLPLFGKESFHPNALGQALIAEVILQQTHNFQAEPLESSEVGSASDKLLQAPVSGRQIYNRIPAKDVVTSASNNTVTVQVYGANYGLRPNTSYQVFWDQPTGDANTAFTSDISSNLSGTFTPPEAGIGSVHIVGAGQDGQTVDLTTTVYIPSNDSDADGDGTPDSQDSCPLLPDSGIDENQNGIDDTCETITPGATNTGTGENDSGDNHGQTTGTTSGSSDPPPPIGQTTSSQSQTTSSTTPLQQTGAEAGSVLQGNATITDPVPEIIFQTPTTTSITPPNLRVSPGSQVVLRKPAPQSKPLAEATQLNNTGSKYRPSPQATLTKTGSIAAIGRPFRVRWSISYWWFVWLLLAIAMLSYLYKQKDRHKRRPA